VTENAATTVSGIFLPPTIEIDKRSVKQGETVTVTGQTVPAANVATHFNSEEEVIELTNSDGAGEWDLDFDTSPLENEEFHTVKALFEVPTPTGTAAIKSGFSQALSFYVGEKEFEGGPNADLNRDGFVNLIDFSILLFWWGSDGGNSDPPADINQDDTVSLTDFSILLFQWTG
jgi:antitoxin (DNA-binding transcriptional repressor) of toxin-antitoxin stability system